MSKEQAGTYQKFRTSADAQGNLAWAARMGKKALRISPETPPNVEQEFELSDDEKVLWRLIRIARKYIDLEHAGLLPAEQCRAFFRGLVSADVVDIVEDGEAKAVLPVEVDRLRREVTGQGAPAKRTPMKARVYRPNLDGEPAAAAAAPTPPVSETRASSAFAAAPRAAPAPRAQPNMQVNLSAEEQALKTEIERVHAALSSTNHYALLGVPQTADDQTIKAAFLRKAKDWHPDRIQGSAMGKDASVAEKVDALFKRLQDANRTLTNRDERAHYDQKLAAGTATSTAGKKVRRPEEAHVMFMKAEHLAKKREVKQAEIHYRAAIELDWEDPKIATGLAWCIFSNEDHRRDERVAEAKKRLDEVVKKFKHGDAAYKLGLVHRALGDESTAQKKFGEAVRLDANHVEAAREVRLAGMRSDTKRDEEAGFLGKLFRK
jgi:tetratricopeptide (TPR) repeat protein